jgi:hypothetical protein
MLRNCVRLLLFFASITVTAQEGLRPLTYNPAFADNDLAFANKSRITYKKQAVNLQLPFKDDFYYASTSSFPSSLLWADSMQVFVNAGFGIAPPSIGVATFDGLNKHGYPYNPKQTNLNKSESADTLTSLPINLKTTGTHTLLPADSVGLMFYFQARGNGENPEATDSLIVDFKNPLTGIWKKRVWFQRGNLSANTNDTVFKRAFIMITDPAYFNDGFQFRIRNVATTAGNFDHWNVDYVYLNSGLSSIPSAFDDITFSQVPSSFLTSYAAMPYQQYIQAEMTAANSVRIRNNSPGVITMSYEYNVMNLNTGVTTHTHIGGPTNLTPFTTTGYSTVQAHSHPPVDFVFPVMSDSTDFRIKHYIYRSGSSPSNEFIIPNDTVVQFQRFRNYYAFDDGSAEAGYYVNGTGGRMAVKIRLNNPDTLRALRIYFDPAGDVSNVSKYEFNLILYAGDNNGPTDLIYYDSTVKNPVFYNSGFKKIPEYTFKKKQSLGPGTYYVGIQQRLGTGATTPLTVGFDRNNDFRKSMYYDSGTGWTQSGIQGALMLRPVLGKFIPPPSGIAEDNFHKGGISAFP